MIQSTPRQREAAHELALQFEIMLEAVNTARFGAHHGKPGRTEIRDAMAKALLDLIASLLPGSAGGAWPATERRVGQRRVHSPVFSDGTMTINAAGEKGHAWYRRHRPDRRKLNTPPAPTRPGGDESPLGVHALSVYCPCVRCSCERRLNPGPASAPAPAGGGRPSIPEEIAAALADHTFRAREDERAWSVATQRAAAAASANLHRVIAEALDNAEDIGALEQARIQEAAPTEAENAAVAYAEAVEVFLADKPNDRKWRLAVAARDRYLVARESTLHPKETA